MSRKPRVAMIGAGGTIAMGARHPFDWIDYGDSGVVRDAVALAGEFQPLLPDVEILPVPFRALGSIAIGWSDWCELLDVATQTVEAHPDIEGVIITHGTATLEETAFFLDLTWPHDIPLILVGAQRPVQTIGSDAIPNVRAAIAAAVAPELRGAGALVVMNGEVHRASTVSKTANFTLDAFSSPNGPLARIGAYGDLIIVQAPRRAERRVFVPRTKPPRVDMMVSYAGADDVAVRAFVEAGAAAIIVMALPPGRAAAGERGALVKASKDGILIVLASRATRDPIPVQAYNEADGILVAGNLAAHKARILVMLAIGHELTRQEIQRFLLTL